jgi:acyl carrier protein
MEVVAFLEETFAVDIGDEDLVPANLDSVSRLTRLVERKSAVV